MPDDYAIIDANELRRLAEKADGYRNEDLALAIVEEETSGGGTRKRLDVVKLSSTRDPVLCRIRTKGRKKDIPFDIDIKPTPINAKDIRKTYDALFWSESAVRKFVRLYYSELMDLPQLAQLEDAFVNDDSVALIAHIPPSEPSDIRLGDMHVLRQARGGWEFIQVTEYLADRFRSRSAPERAAPNRDQTAEMTDR